jgi:hypothetical protein
MQEFISEESSSLDSFTVTPASMHPSRKPGHTIFNCSSIQIFTMLVCTVESFLIGQK